MKNIFNYYYSMIISIFPDFDNLLNTISDSRKQFLITYKTTTMVKSILLNFIFKITNSYSLSIKANRFKTAINNFKKFTKDFKIKRFPNFLTSIYFMRKTDNESIQRVLFSLIKKLIKSKIFNKFRLLGKYYTIAIDGTKIFTFKELKDLRYTKTTNKFGKTIYYYNALFAKIVFKNGIILPISVEFIENDTKYYTDNKYKKIKQDCEIKAAYRLTKKIKKLFPKLPICILADSLYINSKILTTCEKYSWKYIINYKEKSASSIQEEFDAMKFDYLESKKINKFLKNNNTIIQNISYANSLNFKDHEINIIENIETVNKLQEKEDEKRNEIFLKSETKKFMYITNFFLKPDNILEITNDGGRQRWKIENQGFKEAKIGYKLEHLYSTNLDTAKIYITYLLMAKMFNQLFELGIMTKKELSSTFRTYKELTENMFLDFLTKEVDFKNLKKINFNFIDTG